MHLPRVGIQPGQQNDGKDGTQRYEFAEARTDESGLATIELELQGPKPKFVFFWFSYGLHAPWETTLEFLLESDALTESIIAKLSRGALIRGQSFNFEVLGISEPRRRK